MSDEPRNILEHMEELRKRIVRILISVAGITIFVFVFAIKPIALGDITIPIPFPDLNSNIAAQMIESVESYVLPTYVKLIVTAPSQAFLARMYASIFLGVVLSTPVIAREIAAFVSPGLYENEKRTIRNIIVPTTVLFIGGCIFGYLFVVPFSIDFLYGYAVPIGAQTFITLDELISFVVLFVVAFGISFELPVIMWVLSAIGIVDAKFWRNNWRYAAVALVIFGAVITPDGSGITMWFVALPMMALYLVGYLVIRRRKPTA